jgi:hypothetical protein
MRSIAPTTPGFIAAKRQHSQGKDKSDNEKMATFTLPWRSNRKRATPPPRRPPRRRPRPRRRRPAHNPKGLHRRPRAYRRVRKRVRGCPRRRGPARKRLRASPRRCGWRVKRLRASPRWCGWRVKRLRWHPQRHAEGAASACNGPRGGAEGLANAGDGPRGGGGPGARACGTSRVSRKDKNKRLRHLPRLPGRRIQRNQREFGRAG